MQYLPDQERYDIMQYRTCGRSGLKLPAISLGWWHNFGGKADPGHMRNLALKAFDLGFNKTHPGLYKAVNTRTGEPIEETMPWWNLPETMRAAARSCEATPDSEMRDACVQVLKKCHNAYFQYYLNRDNMLFPYQSISGEAGRVVDKAPAVPEGDPLYHTNLALLDMLNVIARG